MRVGTITDVDEFPKARKPAWKLMIDFGPDIGQRSSSAQIVDLYDKADLVGRQVIAVVNFPAKQIADVMSECLILGLVGSDDGVVLLGVDRKVDDGLRVG